MNFISFIKAKPYNNYSASPCFFVETYGIFAPSKKIIMLSKKVQKGVLK